MTALELSGFIGERRARYDFLGAVRAAARAFVAHRRHRRTLVTLSRLPPHVIRDIGLDPEQVFAALDGSWDEVDPVGLRVHLPRRERI